MTPEVKAEFVAAGVGGGGADGRASTGGDGHDADDGIFWMAYSDFVVRFVSCSICMAHVPQPGPRRPAAKARESRPWPDELVQRSKAAFEPCVLGSGETAEIRLLPTHSFKLKVPRGGSRCYIGMYTAPRLYA